jgi:hypothetical protein
MRPWKKTAAQRAPVLGPNIASARAAGLTRPEVAALLYITEDEVRQIEAKYVRAGRNG